MYDGKVSDIRYLFIVSDVHVYNENVNPDQDIYWLNKEAQQQARSHNSYVFLKSQGPMYFPNVDILKDLVAKGYLSEVPDTVIPIDDSCFNYLIQGAPETVQNSLKNRKEVKRTPKSKKLPNSLSRIFEDVSAKVCEALE